MGTVLTAAVLFLSCPFDGMESRTCVYVDEAELTTDLCEAIEGEVLDADEGRYCAL